MESKFFRFFQKPLIFFTVVKIRSTGVRTRPRGPRVWENGRKVLVLEKHACGRRVVGGVAINPHDNGLITVNPSREIPTSPPTVRPPNQLTTQHFKAALFRLLFIYLFIIFSRVF